MRIILNQFKKLYIPTKNVLTINANRQLSSHTCLKKYDLRSDFYNKILSTDLIKLQQLFLKYEFELRIAGGAVRDLLMNVQPHDIDLATNAVPEQMLEIFEKEGIRIYNKNGIKHGTVTVRINDRSNYEITTLRVDVECYGRQAEVEFTNDWHADAIRRDLTVNALFLDFNGKVYDYVNGYKDLQNKIVRFVGVADKRVKEDYLRILRYFRFYSKVCDDANKHDETSIKAIKNNVEGLASKFRKNK